MGQGSYTLSTDYYDPFKKEKYNGNLSLNHRTSTLFSCYIHSDKGTYNRGDTAKFSIFCIDSETKPYKPNTVSIKILDPSKTEIKTFENLIFVKGKSKIEFNIAEKAVDGDWTFELTTENSASV